MTVKNILFLLILGAVMSLGYTRSRWTNERIFSVDYKRPLRHKTEASEELGKEVDAPGIKVCRTEECEKIASSFIGSMDKSVDPCENFYEFTCGKWAANNPILPGNVDSNPLQMYQTLVHQRISEILEEEPESDDILPVKQAKKWYRSCMDIEKLDKKGITPIASFVTEAGGWPIAMKKSDWDHENYPWQEVESHYARLTSHNIFYDVIATSPSNGSKTGEIVIINPKMYLARVELVHKPAYLIFLKNAVKSFAKLNGVALAHKRYEKEARELVDFEAKLSKLMFAQRPCDYRVDSPIIDQNIRERADSYGSFDKFVDWYESNTMNSSKARIHWQSAIQALFNPLNITVDRSSTTYVQNIGYIRGLGTLLEKTKLRTIVNYVHWNYIFEMLSRTTESMRDEMFKIDIMHLSYGAKERAPRWQECVEEMGMTYAAGYIFTKKYFPESTQVAALEMMKNIKIGLEADIDDSDWLDENFKSLAKDKIRAMKIFTGYPKWYNNATALTDYYRGLTIGTKYLDNILSYMRFERKSKLLPYTMPEDEDNSHGSMDVDLTTVNAEYNTDMNALNVPPTFFQSHLFTPGLPDYVNYGQIGFSVSHEMGHAFDEPFDDAGIWDNEDGNVSELSINILKSYYQKEDCFVDQFDRYFGVTAQPEDVEPEDGEVTFEYDDFSDTRGWNTKSENIADSIGLQAVFRAYKNLQNKTLRGEPKLPGLESFSDDQLFFMAFGANWCFLETVENAVMMEDDSHSPGNLRVNGGVSNSKDFAKAFGCPEGSTMNPRNKCNFWEKSGSTPKEAPIKRIKRHQSQSMKSINEINQ